MSSRIKDPSATMKAAIATGFGEIEKNIHIQEDYPTPLLPDTTSSKKKDSKDTDRAMLIRVLACALAPGDVRVLSGKTDYMQLPKSGHPYVVGSDTSGIVVEVSPNEPKFKVGDYVVARFDEPQPNGGVAEYRVVKTWLCEKCPSSISPAVACGLPASAMAAKRIVTDYLKPNYRVLIIGGSGSVGSSVIQYCKLYQAGYIVAVSTQDDMCKSLGANEVIDYREQNWWEMSEFKKDKFDVVFDLVNGKNWTEGGCAGTAVKRNGIYLALLTGVETEMEAHGVIGAVKIVFSIVGRMLYSRLNPRVPKWVAPEALALRDGDLRELLQDVEQGRLKPTMDPASPFDFTEKGVRDALRLQKSVHAHGKVVIKISDD